MRDMRWQEGRGHLGAFAAGLHQLFLLPSCTAVVTPGIQLAAGTPDRSGHSPPREADPASR